MEFQFQGESPSAFQSGDDEKSITMCVPPKFDQVTVGDVSADYRNVVSINASPSSTKVGVSEPAGTGVGVEV